MRTERRGRTCGGATAEDFFRSAVVAAVQRALASRRPTEDATLTDTELCYVSATELRDLIRSRQLSPLELVDAVIARAEALEPRLNALCTPTFDSARDAAKAATERIARGEPLRPLEGLPVTIKDLVMTKGVRTMAGSHRFADRVPDFDGPVVERLREAGAISIGKTTVPEFGWKGCGDSPLTGITHNPWKHGYNAGGSSAGAGACAAAGIGPLHQGSDGGGSIRMPASFCGIYGFKPSYGRVPYAPMPNNDKQSHIGPMTRTVADAALLMSVWSGPDDRDQASLEGCPAAYLDQLDVNVRGLKVAWSPDLGHFRVDPEVAEPVRAAVAAFEELGCIVEEIVPDWDDPSATERRYWSAHMAGNHAGLLDAWGTRMDPGLVACIEDGLKVSILEYMAAKQARLDFYAATERLFRDYDLLVTPSLSVATFPAERLMPEHWPQHPWDWLQWAGFCYPFNWTWQPAATCPCGFTADGRPVGLQIVGPRLQDLRVLQASRAFERARPWAQHRPPL